MADKLLDDAALMRKAARTLRADARDLRESCALKMPTGRYGWISAFEEERQRYYARLDLARQLEARSNSSDGAKEAG